MFSFLVLPQWIEAIQGLTKMTVYLCYFFSSASIRKAYPSPIVPVVELIWISGIYQGAQVGSNVKTDLNGVQFILIIKLYGNWNYSGTLLYRVTRKDSTPETNQQPNRLPDQSRAAVQYSYSILWDFHKHLPGGWSTWPHILKSSSGHTHERMHISEIL